MILMIPGLNSSDQEQNQPYQQDRTQDAAREIAPTGAVGVGWKGAEKHQNQNHKYNGA
jgi:hypothetical protein